MIEISIIIPSYNSENTIRKCLHSLLNQSCKDRYEIILVDSSKDKTPQIVKEHFPGITFVHLEEKTDPGTARNIGLGKAKGELIAFIDSDCIAAEDWLENIKKAHDSSGYNVVGGTVANGNKENDWVGLAGYIAEFREFLPQRNRGDVQHIPTCNISYKRKIFDTFGLFQGKYYPQEDLVYNYNLVQNNEKILMEPSIRVSHNHRSGLQDFLGHQEKIGRITSKVLKGLQLEGAFIARHPFICLFLFPVLPVVKFFRTLAVFLKFQPKVILKRPLVLCLFALGLMFWGIGFFRGAVESSNLKKRGQAESAD
jgi:glycosyltransferase involved in cell wall biosynthesis